MTESYNYSWESWLQKWFVRLLVPAILINAGGLLIPILEPDGALYATIAKTIARTGDFINLRVEGKDWLDKPHFPFWMAALSFRLFGINSFAYKFPALLFWGMGAWYTYRLALSLYGKPVAQLGALVYVSAAHLVISNNDVRAEPYLTGLVIGAVFHFYKASRGQARAFDRRVGWHLVAGSFMAACAVMTKGPFVLITISAGLILDWVVRKDWVQFGNIRWWVALLLVALFITPELYCLYIQFDLHPEKVIFGQTRVSGIRFFFWDSQFGRFFNTGPIKGSGDPFFYFHTLLWAFLPWSLLLYAAMVQKGRKVSSHSIPGDAICLGAAAASFIVFSLSRFQLPHYLNILFPFFSILTAGYLYQLHRRKTQKILVLIQRVITLLLPLLLLFLSWFFHFRGWPFMAVLIAALTLLSFRIFQGNDLPAVTARNFWSALLAYTFVNFCLYPAILRYQAGTQAGDYIRRELASIDPATGTLSDNPAIATGTADPAFTGIDTASIHPAFTEILSSSAIIYMPSETSANYSFEFYCPISVERIPVDSIPRTQAGQLLFIPSAYADSLVKRSFRVENIRHFPNFHISQLTGTFLNEKTRSSTLEEYSLVRVH
ncbi:MAG TPA: glycosyltransferase family 39 protein [Puia sp.]|nr:glycosyltransferase family 39 protein [Puia sp.]